MSAVDELNKILKRNINVKCYNTDTVDTSTAILNSFAS